MKVSMFKIKCECGNHLVGMYITKYGYDFICNKCAERHRSLWNKIRQRGVIDMIVLFLAATVYGVVLAYMGGIL